MNEARTVTSADGTPIAVESTGSGPTLVLVDPAGSFRGFGPLEALAPLLAETFTVHRYDRRGRGESGDGPRYAVDREVEDLRAVVDMAAGGGASVFGYSSGATLALHAAARGVPVARLVLFEPPVRFEDEPPDETLGAEVAELVAAGRRGDAVEHFNRSCGVPEEMIAGLRELPAWPALEASAHTLVYDTHVTNEVPDFAAVTVPVLVLDSGGSSGDLQGWARRVAERLPQATHRSLAGGWHGAEPEDVVAAIRGFADLGSVQPGL